MRDDANVKTLLRLTAVLVTLSGCVYVPHVGDGIISRAVTPNPRSRIAVRLDQMAHPPARALVIENANLALTSRIDLIEAADASVDVQYFIWQNDPSGILVLEKLLQAADRGVRVRALMDDVQLEGLVNRMQERRHAIELRTGRMTGVGQFVRCHVRGAVAPLLKGLIPASLSDHVG